MVGPQGAQGLESESEQAPRPERGMIVGRVVDVDLQPGAKLAGMLVERRLEPALAQSAAPHRSEEHTSELQSQSNLVCRLLLEKKKKQKRHIQHQHHYQRSHSPLHSPQSARC